MEHKLNNKKNKIKENRGRKIVTWCDSVKNEDGIWKMREVGLIVVVVVVVMMRYRGIWFEISILVNHHNSIPFSTKVQNLESYHNFDL